MSYDHNRGRTLSRYSRNQTGCIGISIVRSASGRRDGTMLTYFSAHVRKANGKPANRKFCVNTLGRAEAWRRALRLRAQHEERVARESAPMNANNHSRKFASFAGGKSWPT